MTEHEDDTRDAEPGKLASELEHEAAEMEQRSEDLDDEIGKTRRDWEAKRRDPSEAGAAPPPEGEQDTGPGAPPPTGET
jgi:hypothetical protein